MTPHLDQAGRITEEVVHPKEDLKPLQKGKAAAEKAKAATTMIAEAEKAYRDLETQAANIDAAVFVLKAITPNLVTPVANRTPTKIIESIVRDALSGLSALVTDPPTQLSAKFLNSNDL